MTTAYRIEREARAAANHDAALAEFLSTRNRIDAMIAALQAASSEHFGKHPDEINWTDVAEAKRLCIALETQVEQFDGLRSVQDALYRHLGE
jgi:hypothetical protein